MNFELLNQHEQALNSQQIKILSDGEIVEDLITDENGNAVTSLLKNKEYIISVEADSVLSFQDTLNSPSADLNLTSSGGLNIYPSFKDSTYIYFINYKTPSIYNLSGTVNFEEGHSDLVELLLYKLPLHGIGDTTFIQNQRINNDGSFVFDSLLDGRYMFQINSNDYGFYVPQEFNYEEEKTRLTPTIITTHSVSVNLNLYTEKDYYPAINAGEEWLFDVTETNTYSGGDNYFYSKENYISKWEFHNVEMIEDSIKYQFTETRTLLDENNQPTEQVEVYDRYLFETDEKFGFLNMPFSEYDSGEYSFLKTKFGPDTVVYKEAVGLSPNLELVRNGWFKKIRFEDCSGCNGDFYTLTFTRIE